MNIVFILLAALVALLILLLIGWKALGWFVVGLIVCALVVIGIIPLVIASMNEEEREKMASLEKRIKEKESQGYTEEELEDLKKELYLMRKTHE